MTARLPFNPGLNRVILADLPGMPPGAAGSTANQWLCSWAIGQRMAEVPRLVAAAREVSGGADRLVPLPTVAVQPTSTTQLMADGAPWPAVLDALVTQGNPRAHDLADDLGRVLGGLVATLVLGPEDARRARPEWPASQWDRWSRVGRLVVGGGIVVGDLGERMVEAARATLGRLSVPVALGLASEPPLLVLRGAASGDLADGVRVGIALDGGGSAVKRAVVVDGRLDLRPMAPAPGPDLTAHALVVLLADAVLGLATPGDEPLGVAVAVATYVDEAGQPYAGQLGPYASLAALDLVGELTRALAQRLGRPVTVRVRHDGAAALLGARLEDPAVDAVIVLGTAIGCAFDPRP